MEEDRRLEELLDAFATRARRTAPVCDNEEQTKVSLINPYLEILGHGVRDPLVCRLEYPADFAMGREKVDDAVVRDGRPAILIEAKSARPDFSAPLEAPAQLQRYFMAEKAEFAALTNGVVWQWFRGHDRELAAAPFLVHDVRDPGATELPWLRSVSEPNFDPDRTRAEAESASMAAAILGWIEENRHRPSDDLLRLILRARNLGHARPARVERLRASFVTTFQDYMERVQQVPDRASPQGV